MSTTKEFESWWKQQETVPHLEQWQSWRVKRLAFNAWKHGRKKLRKRILS